MENSFREKGWEFWLGAAFVAAAAAIIGPALFVDAWRLVVRDMGAAVAAFAVVGASLIAYSGAIAKVRFDRHAEQDRLRVARRNVHLKVNIGAAVLMEEASSSAVRLRDDMQDPSRLNLDASNYRVTEPAALEEAWDSLDMLPDDCQPALRGIRVRIKRAIRDLGQYQNTALHDHALGRHLLRDVLDEYDAVVEDAKAIIDSTHPEIYVKSAPHADT